jgi:hypothetical protein
VRAVFVRAGRKCKPAGGDLDGDPDAINVTHAIPEADRPVVIPELSRPQRQEFGWETKPLDLPCSPVPLISCPTALRNQLLRRAMQLAPGVLQWTRNRLA